MDDDFRGRYLNWQGMSVMKLAADQACEDRIRQEQPQANELSRFSSYQNNLGEYITLATDQQNSHSPSAQTFNTPISHDSNSIRSNIDYKPYIYEMIPSQTPDGYEAERRGADELDESFQDVRMTMNHVDVHLVEPKTVRLVSEMQCIENRLESAKRFWEDATQQRLRNLRSREDESQQLRLRLAKLGSITSPLITNDVDRFEQSSQAQTVEIPHPLHIQVDTSINTQLQQSHAPHPLEQHKIEIEQQIAELDGLIPERVKILHFCEGFLLVTDLMTRISGPKIISTLFHNLVLPLNLPHP
ncbi:hypothetical protein QAD02_007323 [Eretmocerus hayati]|uniref:Uncharacterized protein n=1 Tax=Eretmocerus hayati TaxID=131215 RepID=A0ACC2N3N4_9HYME|nr:hypothetical protein QAD02_007323 [Eretmocerus hayati]